MALLQITSHLKNTSTPSPQLALTKPPKQSIPQTRLRLQKQLVGIKHVPYTTNSAASSSSISAAKGKETSVIRDMRPDEDDEEGTWAEGEVVVPPGLLVQPARGNED